MLVPLSGVKTKMLKDVLPLNRLRAVLGRGFDCDGNHRSPDISAISKSSISNTPYKSSAILSKRSASKDLLESTRVGSKKHLSKVCELFHGDSSGILLF